MRVENLITGAQWHIDKEFGLTALNKYLHDLELINSGQVKVQDLYQRTPTIELRGGTAIVRLSGVMQTQDGLCSRGIYQQVEEIEQANKNQDVENIILYVNSGGGESQAGTILHNAIKDSLKPVYVVGEMIASAAYNASLAAKKIYLTSTMSQAGSIGSMITLSREGLKYYKDNFEEIYSGVSPDKNLAWRKLLEGDKNELQKDVTENAQKFVEKVREFRTVQDDALTGGMYYGQEAIGTGLVDGIKTINEVINLINLKKSDMNFTEKFNSMLAKINAFFGWNAKDETDVTAQLDSLGENFDAFKSNLTNQITESVTAQLNLAELQAQLQSMNDSLQQMTEQVQRLTQENAELSESNREMTATILDLRGRTPQRTNSEAPRYEAEKPFIDAFGNVTLVNTKN